MVALTPAQTVATATGAAICLLTIIDDASSDDRARATADLEAVAVDLRSHGLVVDASVRQGDPAAEIILAATKAQADLIAMATHGRGGPARALLGSVADAVVRNAHRSVLLPRRGARGDSREAHAADRDTVRAGS